MLGRNDIIYRSKRDLDLIAAGIDSYVGFPRETDFLFVNAMEAKHGIIEIGSWQGRSSIILAYVASLKKIPIAFIDPWDNCDLEDEKEKTDYFPIWFNNMADAGFFNGISFDELPEKGQFSKLVIDVRIKDRTGIETEGVFKPIIFRMKSETAYDGIRQAVNKKEICFDFLFIDGDHSVKASEFDYTFKKLLEKPNIVILHDIMTHPGPRHILRRAAEIHSDYRFIDNIAAIYSNY